MICPVCKNEVKDDALYCTICGSKTKSDTGFSANYPESPQGGSQNPAFAPVDDDLKYPGEVVASDDGQLPGFDNSRDSESCDNLQAPPGDVPNPQSDHHKKPKKTLIITIIVALLVGVAAVVCYALGLFDADGKKTDINFNYTQNVLYLSGDEINYYDISSNKSYVVASGADETDASKYSESEVYLYEKGSLLFYREMHRAEFLLDYYENEYDKANLCVRDFSGKNSNPMVIDDEVIYFYVYDDCEYMIYEKLDGLYEYDIKEGKSQCISQNDDAESYEGVYAVYSYTYLGDGEYVFCDADDDLYIKKFGGESKKIDSSVTYLLTADTNCGFFVYGKDTKKELKYADFVDFDNERYASQAILNALYEDCSPYYANEIYYCDGEKSTMLTDCGDYISTESGVLYFEYEFDTSKKTELSQISDIYDVESFVRDNANRKYGIYKDESSVDLDLNEKAIVLCVSKDIDEIYYLTDDKAQPGGDLFKVSVKGNKASKPEKIDENVLESDIFIQDEKLYYTKNYNAETDVMDFCADKKVLAKGTNDFYLHKNGSYCYVSDVEYYDEYNYSASFVINVDGKDTKVVEGDNVFGVVLTDGTGLYVCDDGEQYVYYTYKDGKAQEITTSSYDMENVAFSWEYGDYYHGSPSFFYVSDSDMYIIDNGAPRLVAQNVERVWTKASSSAEEEPDEPEEPDTPEVPDKPGIPRDPTGVEEFVELNGENIKNNFMIGLGLEGEAVVYANGYVIYIDVYLSGLNNVSDEDKKTLQDVYSSVPASEKETILSQMRTDIPELEEMIVQVHDENGDYLATITF